MATCQQCHRMRATEPDTRCGPCADARRREDAAEELVEIVESLFDTREEAQGER
jgi:hypothetical protein